MFRAFHTKRFGYSFATFSPDGDSIITFTQDSIITFWSISNFKEQDRFILPPNSNIKKMAISVESKFLVAGGDSPYIYIFKINQPDNCSPYQLPLSCETVRDMKFI